MTTGIKRVYDDHPEAIHAAAERFWRFVDKSTGQGPLGDCWMWTGYTRNGYGSLSICNYPVYSHRLSYFYKFNKWPSENACHRCDTRACVNPSHLLDRNQAFNLADMRSKNRGSNPPVHRGENHHMVRLTEASVIKIRSLMDSGIGQREIAKQFGVSNSTAWRIGNRVTRAFGKDSSL